MGLCSLEIDMEVVVLFLTELGIDVRFNRCVDFLCRCHGFMPTINRCRSCGLELTRTSSQMWCSYPIDAVVMVLCSAAL